MSSVNGKFGEILYILKQLNYTWNKNYFLFSILEDTIEFNSKHRLNYLTKIGNKNTRKHTPIIILTTSEICLQVSKSSFTEDTG
jgi:hypothetical protein